MSARSRTEETEAHSDNAPTIHELIYDRLEELGVIALIREQTEASKSECAGFMDLHFDRLHGSDGVVVISLVHYFEQNGDLCCDPDMEIRVCTARRSAEALAFRQAMPPIYQEVSPEPGKANLSLKESLDDFLLCWLSNCVSQGHRFGTCERGA